MDHAGFLDKPLPGLDQPGRVMAETAAAGADAFILTLGSASRQAAELGGAGLWLSVDSGITPPELAVTEAVRLGADGLKCLVYPWWDAQPRSLAEFAAFALACRSWNMPLMAEVLPGGFQAGPELRTAGAIAAGARVAFEAGADVVKTIYPGTPEAFAKVRDYCPAPVIVLGGERANDERAMLQAVRDALDAGAAGVAVGRNIWQHARPGRMTAALASLIHSDATVDEAARHLAATEM